MLRIRKEPRLGVIPCWQPHPPLLTSTGKEKRWGRGGYPFDVKIHMDPSPAQMRAMGPYC